MKVKNKIFSYQSIIMNVKFSPMQENEDKGLNKQTSNHQLSTTSNWKST